LVSRWVRRSTSGREDSAGATRLVLRGVAGSTTSGVCDDGLGGLSASGGGSGRNGTNNASAACVGGVGNRVAHRLHLTLLEVVHADGSDIWDGFVSGSGLAETERLVKSIAELSSLALGVEALVECILELGVIAEAFGVAGTAGDVLRVGPALGDTA
jgi:hypothetical protein